MQNDFEKLVVAKKYINLLKDELSEAEVLIKTLKFELTQKEKLSANEKFILRTDERVASLVKKNKALREELKKCKSDKDQLIIKLNK